MMTCGLLQIEKAEKDDVVGMISFQGKKTDICRLQHTNNGPSKLVLTRLVVTYNGNYNALLYNYRNSHNTEGHVPMFQIEINRLTRSDKFFTSEELER